MTQVANVLADALGGYACLRVEDSDLLLGDSGSDLIAVSKGYYGYTPVNTACTLRKEYQLGPAAQLYLNQPTHETMNSRWFVVWSYGIFPRERSLDFSQALDETQPISVVPCLPNPRANLNFPATLRAGPNSSTIFTVRSRICAGSAYSLAETGGLWRTVLAEHR